MMLEQWPTQGRQLENEVCSQCIVLEDAINEVRVLSSLKHPYIVPGSQKGGATCLPGCTVPRA